MIHQVEAVMALIRHWRVFNLIFYTSMCVCEVIKGILN